MMRHPLPRIDYELGEEVYLLLATERRKGMITGINLRPGLVTYTVAWGAAPETFHYAMELTREYVPSFDVPAE